MLIRKSLRKEMEEELKEITESEIEAELKTCALIKKAHAFISQPSVWWENLKIFSNFSEPRTNALRKSAGINVSNA